MSLRLRIIIIVGMAIVLLYIFICFGLLWSLIAIVIAVFGGWPKLLQKSANLLGIYDPVNMLAFFGLGLAIFVIFSLMMEVSKQSEQIKRLTQEIAILRKDSYDSIQKVSKEKEVKHE